MPQDEEIDLLIATDCISEGQNLQDCDWLINYDIHWNPVRLIQRFGRIDRLGSINEYVQLINFWPTDDLNNYINLRNRVEARMALMDASTTTDDNILLPQAKKMAEDDLNYRDKQLLRFEDEVLDLEDFDETIALNDFSLDDFRAELTELLDAKRKKLKNAPFGIYAVAPPKEDYPPGVIFCFEQKETVEEHKNINPLQPFYLIYVRREDKRAFYSFVQAKQLLEAFRSLCYGVRNPSDELCREFNRETDNGENMSEFNELLKIALNDIKKNFSQANAANIFSGRSGQLVNANDDLFETSNFRLVTWLIVR